MHSWYVVFWSQLFQDYKPVEELHLVGDIYFHIPPKIEEIVRTVTEAQETEVESEFERHIGTNNEQMQINKIEDINMDSNDLKID
jgi:hypothetical protein